MGSGSERMIEEMERHRDSAIAKYLGLTSDEYDAVDAYLEEDTSNDGMVYGTYVVFPMDADPSILKKVRELDGDRVILPAGFFDSAAEG